MADREHSGTPLLLSLVSALVIVVAIQAWYMAQMQKQIDELRKGAVQQAASAQPADSQAAGSATAPEATTHPPAATPPGGQRRSPFWDDRFNAQNWDPYQEFRRMQREMDQMFNEAFGRFDHSPDFKHLYQGGSFTPDIDLKDEGDKYVAMVDLPGAEESDISVKLEDQVLTISGKQKHEQQDTDTNGNTVFRERRSGTFRRSITLPEPVKQSGMHTELDNGVLRITIPKAG